MSLETTAAVLALGFIIGFAVREFISRRRHQVARRRHYLENPF